MRLYFLGLNPGSRNDFIKKNYPGKKPIIVKHADAKTFSQDLGLFSCFFSSDIFSSGLKFLWSYFLRLYLQLPNYLRKKSPRNLKLWTLFALIFCPKRTSENWNFFTKVIFPVFLNLFFWWLSYIDSLRK